MIGGWWLVVGWRLGRVWKIVLALALVIALVLDSRLIASLVGTFVFLMVAEDRQYVAGGLSSHSWPHALTQP